MRGYRFLAASFAASLVIPMLSACKETGEGMQDRFPVFPIVTPITVFKLDVVPAQKLCAIEESKRAVEFVSALSSRYPNEWRAATPFVSLAPSHRVVIGTTELLLLKTGIAISVSDEQKRVHVVVHQLGHGEADELLKLACPQ